MCNANAKFMHCHVDGIVLTPAQKTNTVYCVTMVAKLYLGDKSVGSTEKEDAPSNWHSPRTVHV